MDMIFVRQGEYEKGDKAFPLIKECFSLYVKKIDFHLDPEEALEIRRTDKKRPYFVFHRRPEEDASREDGGDAVFDLSLTHSGDIWICMISQGRCGIDFQYALDLSEQKIAGRFFREGERAYIEEDGDFFDVWCRKEALGKYVGGGFFDDYPDTCPEGKPAEEMNINGRKVFVRPITQGMIENAGIHIDETWRAAYVSESDKQPCVISV